MRPTEQRELREEIVVCEVRSWFTGEQCLYTDDPRIKDIAAGSSQLRISSRYFRNQSAKQPFAWDIVGPQGAIAPIVRTFSRPQKVRR